MKTTPVFRCFFILILLFSFFSATSQEGIPTEFEGTITGTLTYKSSNASSYREKEQMRMTLTTEMLFRSCPGCILQLRDPKHRAYIIEENFQFYILSGVTARDENDEPVRMSYTKAGTVHSTELSENDLLQLFHEYRYEFTTNAHDWYIEFDVADRSQGGIPYLTTQYWMRSDLIGNIRAFLGEGKYTTEGSVSGKKRVDKDKMESYSDDFIITGGTISDVIQGCDPDYESNSSDNVCQVLYVDDPYSLEEYLLNPMGSYTLKLQGKKYYIENSITFEEIFVIEMTFWPKGTRDTISIDGCSILTVGETVLFPVTCKPSGGVVTYWAEGEGIAVSDGGSGALVTGVVPGLSGTVCVKYVTREGKVAIRHKPVSVVEIQSINENNPVKVGLYDVNGRLTNPPKSVSFSVNPSGGASRLIFKPMDEAMMSVVQTGQERLTIQGLQCGETAVQAYTDCDTETGPPLIVVVVNCDDDVMKELQRESKRLKDNLQRNLQQQMELLAGEEFIEADKNGKEAIESIAKGLTELAIAAYNPENAARTAIKETYSLVNSVVSVISNLAREEWGSAIWEAANLAGTGTRAGDLSGVAKTLYDLMSNVEKMAGYLGTVSGVSDRLQELMEAYDKTQKEYFKVLEILHRTCRERDDGSPSDDTQDEDGVNPGNDPDRPQKDKPGEEPGNNQQDIPVSETNDPFAGEPGQNNNDPNTPSTPNPEPPGGNSGGVGIPLDEKPECKVVGIPDVSKPGQSNNIPQLVELRNVSGHLNDIYTGFSTIVLDPLKNELEAMGAFLLKVAEGSESTNDMVYYNDLIELFFEIEGNDKASNLITDVAGFNQAAGACPGMLFSNISLILKR